ncbi:rhomboid family intramembrane serine protease [Nonomuraea recticatena]|uniref:Rhomboid family intramembrane serine protease n=2 Tax=Nonomuraea TaxID=83681 RepID=A0ABP6F4P3_9ACTN
MTSQPPSPPSQPAEQVPTCYRHPGRETWVRCQRCDRPICPDCMRDAAVGFQCPECVAEGNKTVRHAQSVFGGAVVSTPYVTWAVLGINLLAFALQWLTGQQITTDFGMWVAGVAINDQYYRMITAAFLHGSVFHILFNSYALYLVGPQLERAFGHVKFTALYLLSALGGSVLGYWFDDPRTLTVGASGAIFGLFAAIFVVGRRLRFDVRGVAVLIVINLVITFVFPGISWTGHIGGLITGAVLAAAMAYAPRSHRVLFQTLALLGVFLALVALVVIRTGVLLS